MEKSESTDNQFSFKLYLRIRPQKNGKTDLMNYLTVKDAKHLHLTVPEDTVTFKNGRIEADFEYSDIFVPSTTQERVFDVTTKNLLDGFLQGQSCLVMAYGITGSGKTYTILGPEGNQGLIPRALHYIINGMGTFDFKSRFEREDTKITLEMSYLEDYQNCIYDLLSPTIRGGQSKPMLNARSDANGFLHVINLTERQISSLKEGMDIIALGTKEKHVAETKMNLDSSRSHTMCTFNLVRTNKQFMREIIATCRIVDLAGSERLNRTNATGERTQEAGHINADLMYLMQCLRTLVEKQNKSNQKVMFRNCRLTHLLSTSLVGSMAGPVHMIVNISNEKEDFDETFSALEQISIVKSIKIVQSKVDNKPMPIPRTAGGRKLNPFGDDNALLTARTLNGADVVRMKRMLVEKDAELRSLRENFNQEVQIAIEAKELEIRREIVSEIQKRRERGESDESQVKVIIDGMKKNYDMMLATTESSYKTRLHEKDQQIEELNHIMHNLNDDMLKLQHMYDFLAENSSLDPSTADQTFDKVDELTDTIVMQREAMANLNDQINTLQEDLKASQDSEKKLKEENEAMKKKIEETSKEKGQSAQKQTSAESELRTLQAEKEALKKQLEEATKENSQLKQKQISLESEVAKLKLMTDSAIQQAAEHRANQLSYDGTLNSRASNTSIKKMRPPQVSPTCSPPPIPASTTVLTPNGNVSPTSSPSRNGTLRGGLNGLLANSPPSSSSLRSGNQEPPPLPSSPPSVGLGLRQGSPRVSPRGTPQGSPQVSPQGTMQNPPKAPPSPPLPHLSPSGSPKLLSRPMMPPSPPSFHNAQGASPRIANLASRWNASSPRSTPQLNLPPPVGRPPASPVASLMGSRVQSNVTQPIAPPPPLSQTNQSRPGRFAGKNMKIEIGSPTTQKSGHFDNFGNDSVRGGQPRN